MSKEARFSPAIQRGMIASQQLTLDAGAKLRKPRELMMSQVQRIVALQSQYHPQVEEGRGERSHKEMRAGVSTERERGMVPCPVPCPSWSSTRIREENRGYELHKPPGSFADKKQPNQPITAQLEVIDA